MYEYEITSAIGKGATSRVFMGQNKHGQNVIVKRLEKTFDAEHEAAILKMLPIHKHIIRLLDYHDRNIILEYHPGSRLGYFKKGTIRSLVTAIRITISILEGLKVIHSNQILHCDITPHNILITNDDPATVKIIDFGSAVRKNSSGEYIGSHKGATRWYRPPELKKFNHAFTANLNDSSDLYSATCICLYLLNGEAPYRKRQACKKIQNKRLKQILRKATNRNREKRYQTAQELLDVLKPFAEMEMMGLNDFKSIVVTPGKPVQVVANPTTYTLIGRGLQGAVFQISDERCVKIYAKRSYCTREAEVLQGIWQSGICPKIYEIGPKYIVMEYLSGPSLEETLKSTKDLPPILAKKMVNLLKEQERLNFTRIDYSLRHCIFDRNTNLKIIDHVNSFRIIRKRPRRLLKDLKQLGLLASFLDYIKEQEPLLWLSWS